LHHTCKKITLCYNHLAVGVWLSLVERCVRDAEAVGSNPVTPIIKIYFAENDGESHRRFLYAAKVELLFLRA
jgi:hypothetical protein